jgi:hypothetical protein
MAWSKFLAPLVPDIVLMVYVFYETTFWNARLTDKRNSSSVPGTGLMWLSSRCEN